MTPERYQRFLDELTERLRDRQDVLALVGLGSTAGTRRQPDEWSDHDVWVVTVDGAAAAMRDDLSWLPDAERIVHVLRETEHGRCAIYDDGHLAEVAVFDDHELEVAELNDARLLLGDDAMTHRLEAMRATTVERVAARKPDATERFGRWVVQVVVGIGRWARGERLSANQRVRGSATTILLSLVAELVPPERHAALDDLDPHRRFELAYPTLASRLLAGLEAPLPDTVRTMIDVVETELSGHLAAVTPEVLSALRAELDRAVAHAAR